MATVMFVAVVVLALAVLTKVQQSRAAQRFGKWLITPLSVVVLGLLVLARLGALPLPAPLVAVLWVFVIAALALWHYLAYRSLPTG